MKQLSIIIPCFNSQQTLADAVASCYLQGFNEGDFEIVIVDDGSQDASRDMIKRLASEHANIKYHFHKINMGGGAARNTAVAETSSDMIFCLDSDDLLPPGTLRHMYDYLMEMSCDGVAFQYSVKFNGRDSNSIHHIDEFPYVGQRIPIESLVDTSGLSCPLHVVFMFKKNAFEKAGGYPTSHSFDTQGFAWRFLFAGLVAYTCPGATYLHRVNFQKSYYVREAEKGMVNFNWRDILLEHFDILSDDAQNFVKSFDCSDFTRNIFTELKERGNVLRKNSVHRRDFDISRIKVLETEPIKRNSIRGLYLRARSKIRTIIC